MASKLIHPPISPSCLIPPIPTFKKLMKPHRLISATHPKIQNTRFGETPSGFNPISTIKVSEQSSELLTENNGNEQQSDSRTNTQIKTELYQAIQGINRGIFGVQSAKKVEIENLVKLLEIQNPTPNPTLDLEKVGGCWKLVYSTITILGSRRTKLGLRDFVTLGDFYQTIDVDEGKAINVIKFNAKGLNLFNGQLTIEASFKIASKSRVDINYIDSSITPNQLMNLYEKNYDLLLGVFNPEGWLEITYVDDGMRIGRDDKGNIFILERFEEI